MFHISQPARVLKYNEEYPLSLSRGDAMIIPMTEKVLPADGFIFKHSTSCPISARAAEEVENFEWAMPVHWVNVIEERPMSNWVAEASGVKHASPQLLAFKDGKVTKVLSHADINSDNLDKL